MALPPEVARKLGFYVYLYSDPRTEKIFYVGKGVGERVLAHLSDERESRKRRIIAELSELGLEPTIEVLAHQLPDEKTALYIEAAVIDALGLGALVNEVRGWNSVRFGRQSLSELRSLYAAPAADVQHPLILIRINRLYRHKVTEVELYEATRGVWKLGDRRENAKYACAVFESVVREVYEIERWVKAGSTTYSTRPVQHVKVKDRWEFEGRRAPAAIRDLYLNRSVAAHMTAGARFPITYVGCDPVRPDIGKKRGISYRRSSSAPSATALHQRRARRSAGRSK